MAWRAPAGAPLPFASLDRVEGMPIAAGVLVVVFGRELVDVAILMRRGGGGDGEHGFGVHADLEWRTLNQPRLANQT